MADRVERMMTLSMEGFSRFHLESLQSALNEGRSCTDEAERLTGTLVALSTREGGEGVSGAEPLMRAVQLLRIIVDCISDFCESAMTKIREGILFSDTAFHEIDELHRGVKELLHSAAAAFRNGGEPLSRKVADEGAAVRKAIDGVSAAHEKRLISGECPVRNSAVFLDMVDALRRTALHAVALARMRGGAAGTP